MSSEPSRGESLKDVLRLVNRHGVHLIARVIALPARAATQLEPVEVLRYE